MRKKLTKNLGLKILSVLISFAVWLLVVNIDDPVISTTYSGVQVDFINADALTDQGKTYEIIDNTDVISVTVTGKRSYVESISKENIRAVADLSNISYTGNVDIALSTNKNFDKLDSLKGNRSSVSIDVESLKTIHLPINVEVAGDPADGYVVGDVTTNQNTIKISGPESIISTIAKAQTEVSVGSRTSDISTTADIRLYDSKDKEVESSYITTNIKSINIGVSILATKSVPVEYNYSGNPEQGYMVASDPESNYKNIYIAGKQSDLDRVSSIMVPGTAINVDGLSAPLKTSVDISKYLPDGIRFSDSDFSGQVSVTVDIQKTIEKEYNIKTADISILNLPSDLEAEIEVTTDDDDDASTMAIKTVGIKEVLDGLTANQILASIDINEYLKNVQADELAAGKYQMELNLVLPDKVLPAESYYVTVKVSKKED